MTTEIFVLCKIFLKLISINSKHVLFFDHNVLSEVFLILFLACL